MLSNYLTYIEEVLEIKCGVTLSHDLLGEGNFANVYKGKKGHLDCAIKIAKHSLSEADLQPDPNVESTPTRQYEKRAIEAQLQGVLADNPFITRLYNYIEIDVNNQTLPEDEYETSAAISYSYQVGELSQPPRVYQVSVWERATSDLAKELKKYPQGVPKHKLIKWMKEAAHGIDAISQAGCIHRDIKPANLLLFGDVVKVGDLGLLTQVGYSTQHTLFAGSPMYAAPETFENTIKLGASQDLYSLAASCLHLHTGHPPFGKRSDYIGLWQLKQNNDFNLTGLSPAEAHLYRLALDCNPDNRPKGKASHWVEQLERAFFQNDDDAYQHAQLSQSVELLSNYLDLFPEGRHIEAAQAELDRLRYLDAIKSNTLGVLYQYIQVAKNNAYVREAKRKIEKLEKQLKLQFSPSEELHAVLQAFPENELYDQINSLLNFLDDEAFQVAINTNNKQLLLKYIQDYPEGRNFKSAFAKVDQEVFAEAIQNDNFVQLYLYIQNSTNADNVLKARQHVERKMLEDIATVEELRYFLIEFPLSVYRDEINTLLEELDDEAFQLAVNNKDETLLKNYVIEFPIGKHVHAAVAQLNGLGHDSIENDLVDDLVFLLNTSNSLLSLNPYLSVKPLQELLSPVEAEAIVNAKSTALSDVEKLSSLCRYLHDWPKGSFRYYAKKEITALTSDQTYLDLAKLNFSALRYKKPRPEFREKAAFARQSLCQLVAQSVDNEELPITDRAILLAKCLLARPHGWDDPHLLQAVTIHMQKVLQRSQQHHLSLLEGLVLLTNGLPMLQVYPDEVALGMRQLSSHLLTVNQQWSTAERTLAQQCRLTELRQALCEHQDVALIPGFCEHFVQVAHLESILICDRINLLADNLSVLIHYVENYKIYQAISYLCDQLARTAADEQRPLTERMRLVKKSIKRLQQDVAFRKTYAAVHALCNEIVLIEIDTDLSDSERKERLRLDLKTLTNHLEPHRIYNALMQIEQVD